MQRPFPHAVPHRTVARAVTYPYTSQHTSWHLQGMDEPNVKEAFRDTNSRLSELESRCELTLKDSDCRIADLEARWGTFDARLAEMVFANFFPFVDLYIHIYIYIHIFTHRPIMFLRITETDSECCFSCEPSPATHQS